MGASDGGPAFPVIGMKDGCTFDNEDGMSLRDYFAAKAMQALYCDRNYGPRNWRLAEAAYEMADLMIAARETT